MPRKLIATLFALLAMPGAFAQDYPVRPIRIVVPYGAGSNGEAGLRLLAAELEPRLAQRIVVEARPGGGGNVGAAAVAAAPPDGYTLLLGASNNFVINQHLYKAIGFDPLTAFEPVTIPFDIPFLIYTSATIPARTLGELVAWAKSNPEKLNYASSGAGTPPHLGAELLSQLAGMRMTHVPYKSNAQSVAALLAGEVQLFIGLISGAQAHVDAGRLRILATAVRERTVRHPEVPSAAESGFPTLNITTWWGLVAPRGTPKAVVDRLHEAVQASLRESNLKERYAQIGMVHIGNRPAEFAAQIARESAFWGDLIRSRGIRIE